MKFVVGILTLLLVPGLARAHHGVASLGVAGLEGPGAPLETSSSATLPAGSVLAYTKLDYADFELRTDARDDEGEVNAFWIYGVGYGVTDALSLYLFVPFSTKRLEDNSFTTSGFADPSVMAVLGMSWDEGLGLVPSNESLDDLEDWHFTVYGGSSIPLGDANVQNAAGEIDPGMSLGFGTPSFSVGATATKQWTSRLTTVVDTSALWFTENEYDDGTALRFGSELRANAAACWRLFTQAERGLRLDANLEANFLGLGRDEVAGVGEEATGGRILYAVPGARLYYGTTSLGVGVKLPVWNDLNEEDLQQGAEGGENYRLVLSFSSIF